MGWVTRTPAAGAVVVKDGGTGVNAFPFGVRLPPSGLRVYYNQNVYDIGWKDSSDHGATWTGPSTTFQFWGSLPAGQGGGFTTIRRGRSGRLHAAISRFRFGGTYTTTYPNGTGWTIHYDAYYSYSDDGSTWSTPVVIFFETGPDLSIGSFTPMEITEASNGDLLFFGDYYEHVTYMTSAGDLLATRLYRSTDGGASFTYERDIITPATWGGLTSEFQCDVIHDGSTYGILVGTIADYSVGDPPRRRVVRSLDGGVTWNTGLASLSDTCQNRGGMLAHPDGDVIITAWDSSIFGPRWWVSRDQGVTYTNMGAVLSGTTQPSASGTGGYVGNKWVTPFVIDDAGVSPNLGVAWGSGYDDAHGSTFFRGFNRGADVVAPLDPLVITPTAVWTSAAARTVTIANAPALVRSTCSASVQSVGGGLVRFDGAYADRFSASLDGSTWADRVTVSAGTTAIFLGVTPQAGDTTLTARVGVPA